MLSNTAVVSEYSSFNMVAFSAFGGVLNVSSEWSKGRAVPGNIEVMVQGCKGREKGGRV